MFPVYVVDVLQQLSYLALIIITPCVVYTTLRMIILDLTLQHHMQSDDDKFKDIMNHMGKQYSYIGDLRMDVAALNSIKNNPK